MTTLSSLIFVLALLAAAAFFASAETALFSLSSIERRRLEARYPRVSKVVNFLLDHPRRTLIAIMIGTNTVHILASAVVSIAVMHLLGDRAVGVAIALFTVVLVVFGEIVPKTLAVRNNELVGVLTAIPLHIFAKLIMPLRKIVKVVTDWTISFLVHEKTSDPNHLSDKEIQALIEIVQEEGVLDKDEGERLTRLFEFEERSVNEIMTPRPDLVAFNIEDAREELIQILQKYHYTYLPVYEDTLDRILGVISAQEVMLHPEKNVRELLRPPYCIPETKRIDDLLFEMKKSKVRFAICVDEYGGTAGLVTLEDILEEIFGEIYDEYAKREVLMTKISKDEYLMDGKISLKHFSEALGVEISSEVSETLSGFLLEKLGRIPKPKETFRIDNLSFEIREVDRQRIAKILVRKLP